MLDSEDSRLFFDYLNWENIDKAWEDMGLVENAPPEAVKAYEEYKKMMKEENKNEKYV